MDAIEPPLMEHAAAWLYRLAGRETLMLPRLLSVAAWMCAGLAILWLGTLLYSTTAARLAAAAVMMLLPFAIAASRTFQPDPLMTALTVIALALAVRYDRRPSRAWLLWFAVSGAAALIVKPMAGFFLIPPVTAMAIARRGWMRGILFGASVAVIIAGPAAAYYYAIGPPGSDYGLFTRLYRDPGFWRTWGVTLDRAIGWPFLAAAWAGVVLAAPAVRRFLAAAWIGYVTFGLAFAYRVSTHDYYSLPLIPIVALSIGAAVEAVERTSFNALFRRVVVAAGIAAAIAANGATVRAAGLLVSSAELRATAARYERIGRDVGHSERVLSLDYSYGFALMYHGPMVASNWPLSIDVALDRLAGHDAAPPIEKRLKDSGAEFFVATNQAELEHQPDLRAWLDERFTVIDRDGSPDHWQFVVYDLRRGRMSVQPDRTFLMTLADGTRWADTSVEVWSPDDAAWRIEVPDPHLFAVSPTEGRGPAIVRITPKRVTPDIDRSVEVPVFSGGSRAASATFTVRFRSIPTLPAKDPFGSVDAPAEPVALDTLPVTFQGWALDDFELRRIWAGYLDSSGRVVPVGDAKRTWMRPDVAALFPNAHDIYRDGWTLTVQPAAVAGAGQPLVLHFYAENGAGRRAEIGRRTLVAK
jgi:hypothetical protein